MAQRSASSELPGRKGDRRDGRERPRDRLAGDGIGADVVLTRPRETRSGELGCCYGRTWMLPPSIVNGKR
jgi:hypothetical protein